MDHKKSIARDIFYAQKLVRLMSLIYKRAAVSVSFIYVKVLQKLMDTLLFANIEPHLELIEAAFYCFQFFYEIE